ncbi:uncharacterized protein [Haliotis cracherodii]|uniref:uncharacterized protein n=1 Tax=Haliotis cracherodii TaxID=6455 RepID=UPI0039EC938C
MVYVPLVCVVYLVLKSIPGCIGDGVGEGNMSVFTRQLRLLDGEFQRMKGTVSDIETKMINNFEMSELSLKEELKADFIPPLIKDLVREAMSEVIMEDSAVSGHVLNEVRRLEDGLGSLERKVESLTKQLADYQPVLGLQNQIESRFMTAEIDLEDLKQKVLHNEHQTVEQQTNIMTLNDRLDITQNKMKLCKCRRASLSPRPSPSTTPAPTLAIPQEEVKRRLLVSPFSATPQEIFLDSKRVQPYPYIDEQNVLSIAFASTSRKILVSTLEPAQILAFDLDSENKTVARRDVLVFGMTVDQQRQLVFMTTRKPSMSICRMKVDGSQFEVLTKLNGDVPSSIAVDPVRQIIYATDGSNIVSVGYDGTGSANAVSNKHMGKSTHAVAVDVKNNVLYFNEDEHLMKLRPNKVAKRAKKVLQLGFKARTFQFYNGSLYIGSSRGGEVDVIDSVASVRRSNDHSTHRRLTQIVGSEGFMAICLVP